MTVEEAKAWLRGERSNVNIMSQISAKPVERYAMVEVADAACMTQAVAVLTAHKYGLLDVDDPDNPPPF